MRANSESQAVTMRASSKKRNLLLKGRVAYLSRSKTELVVIVASADCGESAWEALEHAEILLAQFAFRVERRTLPDELTMEGAQDFLRDAAERRACALIVGSGDSRLPEILAAAAKTTADHLPVIRVPLVTGARRGAALLEPLLGNGNAFAEDAGDSGTFATMAIGEAGAKNAALFVVSFAAATGDRQMLKAWDGFRTRQTQAVLDMALPRAGMSDTSRVVRKASK